MFCQKCHKIGHICKEKKPDAVVLNQKQKQWKPKDKGKDIPVESDKGEEI